jgi:hypothetical protein
MSVITEEEGLNVFQIVGRFMIMYARIEMSLTHTVIVIFEHAGGQRGKKWTKFPRHMKQRKDFLEESFAELDLLAAYRLDWASIQKDMKRPEEIRNGIVHGVWDGLVGDSHGELTFRRMAHDGSPSAEILSTSLHELGDVDNTVIDLARRTQELADRLDKAFVPQ